MPYPGAAIYPGPTVYPGLADVPPIEIDWTNLPGPTTIELDPMPSRTLEFDELARALSLDPMPSRASSLEEAPERGIELDS